MAKLQWLLSNKKQKYAVREYTRCERCGRPHSVYRKFKLCRICFRELAYKGQILAFVKLAGNKKESERRQQSMTMTDPIADMLTRVRNANMVRHEKLELPASNIKKKLLKS